MLFNLFKKKHPSRFIDKTYGNLNAMKRACLELAKKEENVLFIAWFSDTANDFKRLFLAKELPEDRIIEVRNLHSAKVNLHRPVFLEHFPLYAKEEALVQNWDARQIDVYNSLDDGLLQHFGGERILTLMKQMGMHEDETIEHPLISKSIRRAQENIAEKVTIEQTTSSAGQWFQKNIG